MGYRSDVGIVVWAEEPDILDELRAVYAMTPLVQKCGGVDKLGWERFETKFGAGLKNSTDYVKWYRAYSDVQAITEIFDLVTAFYEERGATIGARFARIGEEPHDIEVHDYGDPDICLDDFLGIYSIIKFHNFKTS